MVIALEIYLEGAPLGGRISAEKRYSLEWAGEDYARATPFPVGSLARSILPFKYYRSPSLPLTEGSPQAGIVLTNPVQSLERKL